jgi:hypothetical protein
MFHVEHWLWKGTGWADLFFTAVPKWEMMRREAGPSTSFSAAPLAHDDRFNNPVTGASRRISGVNQKQVLRFAQDDKLN